MITVVVLAVEILIVIVFVVHWVVAFSLGFLGGFGEVDALAACATTAFDDVVGGDGFEVVAFFFVFIYLFLLVDFLARVVLCSINNDRVMCQSSGGENCTFGAL